ncbi:MAG: DNA polymerase III subunit delta [Candidatus Paceibacterota bacterium]
MIKLLFGEDTFRSKKRLKEVIDNYKESHQDNVSIDDFEVSEVDYRDFKDQFRQASMFAERKLVVLRHIFDEKEFKKKFKKDADQWNKSEDAIILFAEEISKSDSLFKYIKKNAEWEQFENLEGADLKEWATSCFDNYDVKVKSDALSTLIEYVGSDLWRLSNEIEKLVNFKRGGMIRKKDVKLLVKPDLETDIFNTIDAFALKNNRKSLNLIQKHLDQGDSPLYILSMINYQLRNLLTVKQLQQQGKRFQGIKNETDLNGFVIKKTMKQARNFTLEEIKKIYHQLLEVDLNIKTGQIDKEPALKSFVANV